VTETITREELQGKLDRREAVVLVEALPAAQYAEAHLPGALSLPYDQVDALAPGLLPDLGAEIVAYCAHPGCKDSHVAAARLAALGYGRVRVYPGGKEDWIGAGLPVERGATPVVR
jgi:rhodanese-related sulfurtransferase